MCVFFTSCASLISVQSAETIENGEVVITAGAEEVLSLPEAELNDYDEGNLLLTFVLIRKGISDKSELQSLISPNSLNFYYKHKFLDKEQFILSYTFGGGYTFMESSFDDQLHIFDLPIGLYATYRFNKSLMFTATPKVVPRILGDAFSIVAGTNFNFRLGKVVKFIPEVGFFYDIQQNNIFINGGIGFAF
jgi:hypothetical protein